MFRRNEIGLCQLSLLVEFARNRHRHKRGGEAQHVILEEATELAADKGLDIVALDEVLSRLAAVDS